MLNNFCYYSKVKVNEILKRLHEELKKAYDITLDNTIYTAIKSPDGTGNSSGEYIVEFKIQNNINKYIWIDNVELYNKNHPEHWENIENIILVDDCIGSGKSIIRYLEKYKNLFRNKNVCILLIHVMEKGLKKIKSYKEVSVFYEYLQKKGIELLYDCEKDIYGAKAKLKDITKKHCLSDKYYLGFDNSESLMAFYNNTPNNTYPIFRYDTENYYSLFPRKNDPRPNFQHNKKLRKDKNYNKQKGI